MNRLEVQTTGKHSASFASGIRELSFEEINYVAGGDDGDGSNGEPADGYAGTEVGSGASNSCKANDTVASCNARMDGYQACNAAAAALSAAASLAPGAFKGPAETLAAQLGEVCRRGVDNRVDAEHRTPMYEQQHSSSSGDSNGYSSNDTSSN